MKKQIRNIGVGALVALWVAVTAFAWFGPEKDISVWERRPLQQMPPVTADALLNGGFMEKFEDYTLDQFPLRDTFRTAKSLFSYYVLQQQDNNGIYIEDGYAAKLEYPLQNASVSNALKKFQFIYDRYLKNTDSNIYVSVIPDKGYYLASANGYPAMDYEKLYEQVVAGMPWAQVIDIREKLAVDDYYRTDTHWRQEKLLEVAQTFGSALNIPLPKQGDFTPVLASQRFYGVYYGQAALPLPGEELYIMESEQLSNCRVYNHETGMFQSVYDLAKLDGLDPYDVYLSGAQALLTMENPNAATDRELIVFRDSFGSSLAPLLAHGYAKITLVDIRYISSSMLGEQLDFHGQDVLFAYSALILNNSISLK